MDNSNTFDWMAVQLQAPDKSFSDLNTMGVDPSQTSLETSDFYKSKPKIQAMFKTPDGTFDDNKFNEYYAAMSKSFNEYKQADTSIGNVATDLWNDNSITRALGLPIRRNPVQVSLASKEPFTALKNAQNSFYGLTEINKWSKPQKTLQEVAESQKVVDSLTGKQLDYTPEDTGLFNLYGFLSEPLVQAQYDEDERDAKGKIIHKKGEFKFNDKGLPFFETLNGRDPSGKQVLSRWNTLTKESSYWNKFDFMDSDDLNKSITGSLVKAAVQYAPMLIPGVNTAYAAYTIGLGLVDGGTEIVKAIDGIMNGPGAKNDSLYKWANELQGYAGQMKGNISEHAKENWWDMENLLTVAVDSVYILKSQNAIVAWPTEFAKYQMAEKLGLETNSMLNVGEEATKGLQNLENYGKKYGYDWVESAKAMSKNMDKLHAYQTYASHISTAYMAATTAASISALADQNGIDARDKGFLYLGYTAALIPFFNSQFGRWVNTRIGALDEFSGALNNTLIERGKDWLPEIAETTGAKMAATTTKGKAMEKLAQGRMLAQKIIDHFKGLNYDSFAGASIANAVDMTSQKAIGDGLQIVYNGLASAGFKSTQQDAKFDIDPMTMAKDLLHEGLSGAMGGAMFHLAHIMTGTSDHAFKSDKLYEYSMEGYSQQVLDSIGKMEEKGQLGSTTLSVNPLVDENGNKIDGMYQPVNPQNPVSQNAFVADRLKKTMKVYDGLKEAYNMVSPNVNAENKTAYYNGIIDSKTDTDLPLQHRNVMKQLFQVGIDIQNVSGLGKESDDTMLEHKAKLKLLKDKLEYLQGDESIDEFFVQGLFNIRSDINTKFGVKNRETIAFDEAGKSYKQLTKGQQEKVDGIYQAYVADEGQTGLMADLQKARESYHHFQEIMEHKGHYNEIIAFRESMEHLKKYVVALPKPYIPEGETKPVAMGTTYKLTQDYLTRLAGVKYVPDYIYDWVKRSIGEVASLESDEVMKALSVDGEQLKKSVNSALKSDLSNDLIKEYFKKLIGEKQYKLLTESKEYKDVVNNSVPENHYSTLKMLRSLSALHGTINESKLEEQKQIIESLRDVEPSELENAVYLYGTDEIDRKDPLLARYDQVEGLFDYIDTLKEQGQGDDSWGPTFSIEGLQRFVHTNALEKKIGQELTQDQRDGLYNSFDLNNIYTKMLLEGKFSIGNEDIHAHTINNLDDSTIHQSMDLVENFDKERVASPVRDNLSDQYDFLKDQLENLNTVGPANYLNAEDSFIEAFDNNLKALERVAALIEATATVNPIINDFRAHHKGMLSDKTKDIVLSILDNDDKNTLFYETGRMHFQIKYLQDINNYNVNNQLAKLLREDGYELVSKVSSLRDIGEDPRVAELLPSLRGLYDSEPISTYVGKYKTATEDEKFEALKNLAVVEEGIYKDFQALPIADKTELINKTFKAISASTPDFYEGIDPKNSLQDSHRTLYLASLYGTSTYGFYSKYVGEYDKDAEGFVNLNKSPYIPFAKQENAIRVANLVINGDRTVVQSLLNSFSYADIDSDSVIDFSEPAYPDYSSSHVLAVLGGAGTGKTTAVLYNIMNMVPDEAGNTIILAPKTRQLGGLENALVKGGFKDRIDERSNTVRKYLESLGLRNKDGSPFDFSKNDEAMSYVDSSRSDEELRTKFKSYLDTPSTVDPRAGIVDNIDMFTRKKLNPAIVNALSKTRLIALDEFTHVNPIDIAILSKLITEYNKSDLVVKDPSKNVSLIALGDENQMGFTHPTTGFRRDFTAVANVITTQPMLSSLRSGWDLINNTLVDVTRRTIDIKNIASTNPESLTTTDVLDKSKNNSIKLFNYQGPDGSIGIKSVKVGPDGVKASDLAFISDNKTKSVTGKDFVYVVNKLEDIPRAQALLRDAFGMSWAERGDIEVYTPDEVQGGEYKYAIIDAAPKLEGQQFDIVRTHEFLNTMLSRASEATLLIDDGSMDQFVKFENTAKERAIDQIKITKKTISDVKNAKQRLVAAILGPDYVPEGAKPGTVSEKVYKKQLPIKPFNKVLFDEPAVPVSTISAKVSNITAYTTFSTKGDFDKIRKLPNVETGIDDAKIENIINSYKYYLTRGREIGEGNVAVAPNFIPYLKDYDYDSPKYFIEVAKREGNNLLQGRSELSPAANPAKEILMLKVRLPNEKGAEDLELTLGALNTLKQLTDKFRNAKVLDDDDRKVNTFVSQLTDFIADPKSTVDWGETKDGTWKSREFSAREWGELSTTWGSRLFYDSGSTISIRKFRELYPDFHISEPQVVVASLRDEEGRSILDADGKNPAYKDYWKKLQSQSVVFMSEYKELQALSADQLLDVYMKQLSLFNTPEFKAMSAEDKRAYVDSIKDRIQINRGQFSLPYKPNMVEMIRLNNPRDSFINFRERYLTSIAAYEKGTPIQQLFEKFDMTPYVKDRLVKSLLTIKQFLSDGKDNRDYFEKNILPQQNADAEARIADIRQQALEKFGEVIDFDQDFSRHDNFNEVVLDAMGKVDSAQDFLDKLNDLLDLKSDKSIFLNSYKTEEASSARVDRSNPLPVSQDDITLSLTSNKQADFSKSIVDLNLLNLFKKTKNLNFAELIDASLTAFSKFPQGEKRFDKYRLDSVFKDGQIETMVVAQRASLKGDDANNVLADVKYAGDSFTFGFKGLQQAAMNINFSHLLDKMTAVHEPLTEEKVGALLDKVYARLDDFNDLPESWWDQNIRPLQDKTYMDNLDDVYSALLDLNDILDRINETVRVPTDAELTLDTPTAYDVSPNGIVATHTVETDTTKGLIENYSDFKKLTHDEIELSLIESDKDKATFNVKTEEGEFKVTYNAKDRSVDLERLEEEDPEIKRDKFAELAGDREADPTKVINTVATELGKAYLVRSPESIATKEQLIEAYGKGLYDNLSDAQIDLFMDYGWHDNAYYKMHDELTPYFYKDLAENFINELTDDKDKYFDNMLKIVHETIANRGAEALANTDAQEEPVFSPADNMKDTKNMKKIDPIDKLTKDLRDENDKSKREFEYKVRDLFKGAEAQDPLKSIIKNRELLHRQAVLNKKIQDSNLNTNLMETGVAQDVALVDPRKLANEVQMELQKYPDLYKQHKKAFQELLRYTIEKTQTNC